MYNYSIGAIVPTLLKEYLVFADELWSTRLWFIIGLLRGVSSKYVRDMCSIIQTLVLFLDSLLQVIMV